MDKKPHKKKIEPKKVKKSSHDDIAKKAEEYLQGWKRAQADLANAEKRFNEQYQSRVKMANKDLVLDLLPVLDNYDRAFDGMTDEEKNSGWAKGFEYIKTQLEKIFEQHAVKRFDSKGEVFDPELHEAIEHIAGKKDVVVEEVLSGYMMHDKVIRHAKVKVGNGK